MSKRTTYPEKKGREKRKTSKPFIMLFHDLLYHENYLRLSNSAKVIYQYMSAKFNGKNRDDISLTYGEVTKMNLMSTATYKKALDELEDVGLIKYVRKGGLERQCNIFSVPEWKDIKGRWYKKEEEPAHWKAKPNFNM